jgi:KaiC/GvpD/RAD55 family RecA-like ATPase
VQFITQMVSYYKKKHGDRFTVFTMDSLGALYSLMDDSKGMRKKMFYFFKTLRDYNLISYIVMERTPGTPSELIGNEGFLVDGIIELGLDRTRGKLVRFVKVEKMRACEHSMERFTLEVGDKGLVVLGPTLA